MRILSGSLLFARMGLRNILKYRRRSIQMGVIIAIAAFVMTFIGGITAGFMEKYMTDLLESTSHAKLFRAGYYEKREISPLGLAIDDYPAAMEKIRKADPAVALSPSIAAGAIVSKDDESLTMLCQGIEPYYADGRVFPQYKPYRDGIVDGSFFRANEEPGILIGSSAAHNLGARVGERIIVFTSDSYGSFNAVELPVIGIFRTGYRDRDENICLLNLPAMQRLVGLENSVTEIALLFDRIEKADTFGERLAGVTEKHGLEYFGWKDLMGSMMYAIDVGKKFNLVIYLIFLIVAGVGVMNTVLISVFDRVRDIGTLRAIGFTKNNITAMVMVELLFLGVAGALAGIAAGGGLVYYFSLYGFGISEATQEIATYLSGDRLYPVFRFIYLIVPFAVASAIPLAAAIYPLFLIRRMQIKDTLGYQ